MDINSKEFKQLYKPLFDKGYCAHCIALLTSSYTIGRLCPSCLEILKKDKKEKSKKMSIVDLLIADLQVDQLNEVQLLTMASRLIDIAIEKINGGSNNEEE